MPQRAFHMPAPLRGRSKLLRSTQDLPAWLRHSTTRLGGLLETSLRGPEYVLQYLGRYTQCGHLNHRLVSFTDGKSLFLA